MKGMKTLFAMHVEKRVTSQDIAKTEGEDIKALSVIHVEKRDT